MHDLFNQYKLPIICGGIGFILALLFVSLGFFKTLLFIFFTALGTALGFYLEKSGILQAFKQ